MRFRGLQEHEFPALARMMAEVFHVKPDGWEQHMRSLGLDTWRVVERDGQLLASFKRNPLSQWFHGTAVANTWISGLGVCAESRGEGTGRLLLESALRELRAEGVPLSGLYGTTQTFYRRLGWECAGSRYVVETPIRHLPGRRTSLQLRKLEGADHQLAESLHLRHATSQGCLRRSEYCWRRLRSPQMRETIGHGFFRGSELRGYCYRLDSPSGPEGVHLQFTDVLLVDAEATQAFLSFLAGYRALSITASWATLNPSPALLALDDPWQIKLSLANYWMLRVVHLPHAICQRTYLGEGELELEILDDVLEDNAGPWRLEARGGVARLEKGGAGSCRLDIRGLAALYSGFASSATLTGLGYLQASQTEQATLDSIFASTRPPQLTDIL